MLIFFKIILPQAIAAAASRWPSETVPYPARRIFEK
jgi:hypothetical protein